MSAEELAKTIYSIIRNVDGESVARWESLYVEEQADLSDVRIDGYINLIKLAEAILLRLAK